MGVKYSFLCILLVALCFGMPTLDEAKGEEAPIVVAKEVWSKKSGGNDHLYEAVFAPGRITWGEAKKVAEAQGGHLATIANYEENEFVHHLVRRNSDQGSMLWYKDQAENFIGPWLGGYQIPGSTEPGSGWIWVTGEPMSYTNWAFNEPNNYNNNEDRIVYFNPTELQDCPSGCIKTWSSRGYWNDFPQNGRTKGYIIEYEGKKPSSPGGPCSPSLDGCGSDGEVQLKQVFFDDFRGGSQNWNLQDGWSLEKSGGNDVLRGRGHKFAVLKGPELDNYALKARFKKNQGNIHFNFRSNALPDGLYRYFVGIAGNQLYLKKQNGNNNFQNLIATNLNLDANWHWIEIRGNGDTIRILIDSKACICYKDSKPIVRGGVSFETLENSDFLIDDVTISKL